MTDTAKTGLEQTTSTTPTPRQTIRESWANYVGNVTYDVTRSAVDFFLEGVLKELSVYAKTTSDKNDTNLDKFKGLVGTFTDFARPKTLAMSDMIGSGISYAAKNLVGNLIGQFYSAAKAQGYELDAKNNKGWINKAVTAFARENVKYMILGGLTFAGVAQPLLSIAPEFLTARIGATLASLLTGAGVGLAGNQLLPSVYQFVVSKLPTKTPEQPKPENKEKTPIQDPVPTTTPESKPTSSSDLKDEKPTSMTVTLRIKSTPTAVTKDPEEFIPVPSLSDNEADDAEHQATLHHQARYTPIADKSRNESDQNLLPRTPEYGNDADVDQEEEYGEGYQSSVSMNDSGKEEGEWSADNEEPLERSRSHSYSSDASHDSSDSSSRSPSPINHRKKFGRIM